MTPREALAHWGLRLPLAPALEGGLINRTWVAGEPPERVLQWVNPIFDPRIHLDMAALTERLAARGVPAPRLVPATGGELWIDDDESGCWRLVTYLPGHTFERLTSAAQAAAAGALVGRFHAALDGWSHEFVAPRRDVHDTPARMAELVAALDEAGDHPLADPCRDLGAEILGDWEGWRGELELPLRPCHGDLKVSNLRFSRRRTEAVGLIDLDTAGPMALASEMGDAWRSWCNPEREDAAGRSRFDFELFAASARAYLAHAPELSVRELEALVPAIERICLELAARFCADAVRNVYFREDRDRHPRPGSHNLLRARGQLRLARSAHAARSRCAAVIETAALSS